MIDLEIDYSSYSLSSLVDAQAHIDRERYPERAAELDQLVVERRRAAPSEPSQPPVPAVVFTAEFPTSPDAERPAGVWFVLVWQLYCVASWVLWGLLLVSGSFDAMVATIPEGFRQLIPEPSVALTFLGSVELTIALVAAIALFLQHQIAPRLFAVALGLEVLRVPVGVVLLARNGFQIALVAGVGVIGCAAVAIQLVYSSRLLKSGWLWKGAA